MQSTTRTFAGATVAVFAIVLLALTGISFAAEDSGNGVQGAQVNRPAHVAMANLSEEERAAREEFQAAHEAVEAALTNNDYDAFLSALTNLENIKVEHKIASMTKERFNFMVEMHQAREAGDTEKIQELRDQMHKLREEQFGGELPERFEGARGRRGIKHGRMGGVMGEKMGLEL